jgi:hypothetical protein
MTSGRPGRNDAQRRCRQQRSQEETVGGRPLLVDVDGQDLEAGRVARDLVERGERRAADGAPARPEIDADDLPAQCRERDVRHDRRRLVADAHGAGMDGGD